MYACPTEQEHDFGRNDANNIHAVTKHPRIKMKIILASSVFEAGGNVSGILELSSSTRQRLRLGEIAIELEAFEGKSLHASRMCS